MASAESGAEPEEVGVVALMMNALAPHQPSGRFNVADGWVECDCRDRLAVELGRGGYPMRRAEENAAWDRHRVEVLAPVLAVVVGQAAEAGSVDALVRALGMAGWESS